MGLVNNCLTPRYISARCILNIAENNLNRTTSELDLCILVTQYWNFLVTQYWNFLSPSGIILPKIIWPEKIQTQRFNLCILLTHLYTEFQFKMSICNGDNERKLKINGIFLSPRGITLPKIIWPDPNSSSTCVFSRHIYILNFNIKCQFVMEIMSGNWKLMEWHINSAKNYSTGPKFELNLRILLTNLYTEFQFKMSICNGDNERKLKINGIFF